MRQNAGQLLCVKNSKVRLTGRKSLRVLKQQVSVVCSEAPKELTPTYSSRLRDDFARKPCNDGKLPGVAHNKEEKRKRFEEDELIFYLYLVFGMPVVVTCTRSRYACDRMKPLNWTMSSFHIPPKAITVCRLLCRCQTPRGA